MPAIFGKGNPFSLRKVLAKGVVFVAAWIADHLYLLKRSSERALDDSIWNFLWDLIVVSAWSWVLVRGQKGRLPLVLSRSTSSCLYGWLL